MGELLSIRAAARRLGVGRELIADALRRGEIAGYRLGRRAVYLRIEELDAWVQSKRLRPTAADVANRVDQRIRRDRLRARERK